MGKSNRIRNNRASDTLFGGAAAPKQKKEMPSWALNALPITFAVLLVVAVALLFMSSFGVFGRMQTAMKSENFRVSQNMMNYYFQSQYSSFVENNKAYLSYYGLDTGKPLKDQTYGTDADGNVTTWFDTMMDSTVEQVKEILVYCEEAEARGITLDEEDMKAIEDELYMYDLYGQLYGTDKNAYISMMYGKGMRESDIKKALELSALASKCSSLIGDEILDGITDEHIIKEYETNTDEYDQVDYIYYTFDVAFTDAKNALARTATDAEKIAKYKEMIEEAKARAEEWAAIKDEAVLKDTILKYVGETVFEDTYKDFMEKETVAEDKMVITAEILKEKLVAAVFNAIKEDAEFVIESVEAKGDEEAKTGIMNTTKDGETTKYFVFETEVDKTFYEAFKKYAKDIFDDVETEYDACFVEGAKFSDTNDALEWAFEDGRVVGDTKTFDKGDGAGTNAVSDKVSELKSFSITVYRLTKTQHKDETVSKNVGIMIFSSKTDAEKAAEKLAALGEITKEKFEEICTEFNGQYTDYENYTKGSFGVAAFDTWLYGDDIKVGAFTAKDKVITLTSTSSSSSTTTSSSYAVAWYYGDGDMQWEITVKTALFNDGYEASDKALKDKHTVSEPDMKVINKIDG